MRATKLWLAFVAASLVSMGAMAQGIHVGYVQSRFSTAIGDGAPSKSEAMNGFEAGFDQTFKIAKGIIAVDYGLNYTYLRGNKAPGSNTENCLNIYENAHYLDIPVHLQIGVPILGVVRVFAYGGPKFVFGLAHNTIYELSLGDGPSGEIRYNHFSGKIKGAGFDDETLDNYAQGQPTYKRFDIMMGVGGGVELFKHLTVKAGYEWGLMNLSKADGMTINRNQFVVSAGLSF